MTVLRDDEATYEKERQQARSYTATLPAQYSPTDRDYPVSVLIFDGNPTSLMASVRAYTDDSNPSSRDGFDIVVRCPNDEKEASVSAHAGRNIKLAWLAEPVSKAEAQARNGVTSDWYDGKKHRYTLVAEPNDKTQLDEKAFLSVLTKELKLNQ